MRDLELGARARAAIGIAAIGSIALGLALARDERPAPQRRAVHRAIPWRLPRIEWEPRPLVAPAAASPLDLDGGLALGIAPHDDLEEEVAEEEVAEEDLHELGPLARELIDRLCAPAARGICARRDRCGCSDPDGAACAESIAAQCEEWVDCRWGWEEDPDDPGALAIDPGAVRGCLDGMLERASECRDVLRPDACERLIVEAARAGERCEGEGGACIGGTCREGICRRLPRAGQECPDWECAAGLVCDGERCVDPAVRGGSCSDDDVCAWEAVCLEGHCVPRRRLGAECDGDAECAIGTRCEDGACARADACDLDHGCGDGRTCAGEAGARCVAAPAPTGCPPGEEGCALPALGAPCPLYVCAAGLVCAIATDGSSRCTDQGVGEGERCETRWGAMPCAAGLACAWTVTEPDAPSGGFTCRRAVGVGEDCERDPCGVGSSCTWGVLEGACHGAICEPLAPFVCGEG